MIDNDLISKYAYLDKSAMLARVFSYPNDLKDAVSRYSGLKLQFEVPKPLKGITIAGMGGSFIGAFFLQDLLQDKWELPLFAIKDICLPAFIDRHHLLVAVSYSGNTEETIRIIVEACKKGVPTVAVTSGGLIAEHAEKLGYPVVKLPPGLAPRAAFPYILTALTAIMDYVIPSTNLTQSVAEAASFLERHCDNLLHIALDLSEWMLQNYLTNRLLVVYGYRPYLSACYRLKTQINENAKFHVFFSELPESNHNEIMGWEAPSNLFTLTVRANEEPPHLRYRMEFLLKLWSERGVPFREVRPAKGNRLEELISLFYIFDLASVLLALKRGVDPTPVETISQLKKYLDIRINLRDVLKLL